MLATCDGERLPCGNLSSRNLRGSYRTQLLLRRFELGLRGLDLMLLNHRGELGLLGLARGRFALKMRNPLCKLLLGALDDFFLLLADFL